MLFLAPCVPTEIRPVSKKIWKRTFLEMNTKKPKSNNAASWRFILLLLSAHTKHETKKFKISNTLKSLCYGI